MSSDEPALKFVVVKMSLLLESLTFRLAPPVPNPPIEECHGVANEPDALVVSPATVAGSGGTDVSTDDFVVKFEVAQDLGLLVDELEIEEEDSIGILVAVSSTELVQFSKLEVVEETSLLIDELAVLEGG